MLACDAKRVRRHQYYLLLALCGRQLVQLAHALHDEKHFGGTASPSFSQFAIAD